MLSKIVPSGGLRLAKTITPKVLVTGTSGHAGGVLARRLQEGGYNVRALVRTEEQASVARQSGWEPFLGDLTQPSTLAAAVRGVNFVLHVAAYQQDDRSTAQAVNVDGTRSLAEHALKAGIQRFVHISTLSVHGEILPSVVNEETPLVTANEIPYVITKSLAELALGELRGRGLDIVILRPGMITNEVRSQWGDERIERMRAQGWPKNMHPDDVMPWVHTENLAEMSWLALTHPAAANEVFIAADRNVAFRDFYGPIANALGKPVTPPSRAPEICECRIGKIAARLGYRPRRTFEETMTHLLELARTSPGRSSALDTPRPT